MKRLVVLMVIVVLFAGGCYPSEGNKDEIEKSISEGTPDSAGSLDVSDDSGYMPSSDIEETDVNVVEASAASWNKSGFEAPDADEMRIILYYRDEDGFVVPVTRRIARVQAVATTAINALINTAQAREEMRTYGLYPVFPAETEVLGISIKDGTATIDFSPGILQYDSEEDERCIFSSVVYTLTQFPTIKDVVIWINGYAGTELKFGSSISGAMNRDNTMINCRYLNSKGTGVKADIYYFRQVNEDMSWLVPVSVEAGDLGRNEIPEYLIELMARKVNNKGIYSELPEGTRILDCYLDGRSLTLNFNNYILNYGGAGREEGLLQQILFTMGSLGTVDRVRFLIDGKEKTLPEGTDVYNWLTVPENINDYIDK